MDSLVTSQESEILLHLVQTTLSHGGSAGGVGIYNIIFENINIYYIIQYKNKSSFGL